MATRQVTTVFAVEGERDYKQAVQNINREIQNLNAKLDLNATAFKGQEDSMLALEGKAKILNDLYDKQEEKVNKIYDAWNNCKDSAEKYRQKIKETERAIDDTKKKLDEMDEQGIDKNDDRYKSVRESYKKLTDTLSNEQAKFDAAVRGAQSWETAFYNAEKNLTNVQDELDETLELLDEKVNPKFHDTEDALDNIEETAPRMSESVINAVEAVGSVAAAVGLDKAFERVRDAMQDCIDKSVQFESDVAGVFKTVDLTAEEESAMSAAIKDLSTRIPATTTEIAGVAEAAGQLGIAKDDILEFTEVMLMMGTATNVGAVEAAESLAKFSGIMGIKAEDYEKLGATIVDLGNKNETAEKDIIEFATRMASASNLVGLSAADVLAYAAALHSTGMEAEAGGTAISKLFKRIEIAAALYSDAKAVIAETGEDIRTLELLQANNSKGFKATADAIGVTSTELSSYIKNVRDLEDYARNAGVSPEDFIENWNLDPAGTLNDFIKGLGEAEQRGENVIVTLNEMGLTEARLSMAVQNLASNSGKIGKTLAEAHKAWEEGTALSEEAERRYDTSASKLQILENAFDNFKIAIGDDYMATLEPIIEGLTNLAIAGSGLVEEEPGFSTALSAIGGGLGAITAVTGAAAIVKGVAGALALFGPHAVGIAAGAAAIGALATGVYTLVQNSNGVSESVQAVIDANDKILEKTQNSTTIYDKNKQAADENRDKVNLLIEKLWAFHDEANKTPADKEIIQGVVDQLNELLPGLGLTYDGVTEKINLTRQEMQKFADDAANQKMLDALNGYMDALLKDNTLLEVQARETDYAIQSAQKRYEDAVTAYNAFDESLGVFGDVTKYLPGNYSEWNRLSDEVWAAKRELDALKDSAELLNEQLEDNKEKTENASKAYDDMVAEMADNTETATQTGVKVGEAFVDGMVEGLNARREKLRKTAVEIGTIPPDTVKAINDINSPSKVAEEIGRYFGDGLALGLEESENKVRDAAEALAGKFDISADVSAQFRKAQSEISTMSFKPSAGGMDFDGYPNAVREMNRAAMGTAAYASGMRENERVANITIVQQLDGKVLSREVSRVQFNDTKLTARARGMR